MRLPFQAITYVLILLIGTNTLSKANAWTIQLFGGGDKCRYNMHEYSQYENTSPSECQIIGDLGNNCQVGNYEDETDCGPAGFAFNPTVIAIGGNATCKLFQDATCESILTEYNTTAKGTCAKIGKEHIATSFTCHDVRQPHKVHTPAPLPSPTPQPWSIEFYYGNNNLKECNATVHPTISYEANVDSKCQIIGRSGYECTKSGIDNACGNITKAGARLIRIGGTTICSIFADIGCSQKSQDLGPNASLGYCYEAVWDPSDPAVGVVSSFICSYYVFVSLEFERVCHRHCFSTS
ncbi:hypothetical protein MMC17_009267 [Xylographa soralifera]|nr:hypothetical protein [Xylographa soralifera]